LVPSAGSERNEQRIPYKRLNQGDSRPSVES
jgi:hypothetical protein